MRFVHYNAFRPAALTSACAMVVGLAIADAIVAHGAPPTPASFGHNLIVNGDAESGPGAPNDSVLVPSIPGWARTGRFNVVQYGAAGGFTGATDPGPVHRGKNYFVGGPNNPESSASQTIDLSKLSAPIDKGGCRFLVSAYIGGFASQADYATVTLTLLGADGRSRSSVTLGPVTPQQRQGRSSLLFRKAKGSVPTGVRRARVVMHMVRKEGSYSDGSVDNVRVILFNGPVLPAAERPD